MSWLSQGLDWVGDHLGGGGKPPSPMKFNTGPQSPVGTGSSSLPTASGSSFTSAQQSQIQNALSAAGIWDTIQGLGGDVWSVISKVLPKNADGSIDWGGALKDVGGWVSAHKKDIVDAVSAYNAYQRQGKADALGKEAVDLAKQHYDEKAPLRVAGQAGMLNPQANAPDLSSLKAGIPTPTIAPLPVAGSKQNLQNAQGIAGPGSGNPFAPQGPVPPLPVAGAPGAPSAPPGPHMSPMTPQMPRPLPIANTPPVQMPATAQQPLTPSGLPVAQSGPISAGPQRRPFAPQAFARPVMPNMPFDPNNPNNPQPLPVAGY